MARGLAWDVIVHDYRCGARTTRLGDLGVVRSWFGLEVEASEARESGSGGWFLGAPWYRKFCRYSTYKP